MLRLYRLFLGELVLLFSGESPERILNISAQNKLLLRCIKITKKGIVATIPIYKFKILPQYIKKTGIKVHIIEKNGIPFSIRKYNNRIGLVFGLIIFISFLEIMSGYIWNISIIGNTYVDSEKILNVARDYGIYEGVKKKNINTTADAQKVVLKIPQLAWCSLNIENCNLTINVTEIKQTDKDNSKKPCNLIATNDGIISSINVTSGDVKVKMGDVVSRGEVLVSGIGKENGSTIFVHSKGEIKARTERIFITEGLYEQTYDLSSNKTININMLKIFNVKIPLYLGKIKVPYSCAFETKEFNAFGNKLPISLYTKKCNILKSKRKIYSKEELIEKLENEINSKIKKSGLDLLVIKNKEIVESTKGITIKMYISAEEIISKKDLILID